MQTKTIEATGVGKVDPQYDTPTRRRREEKTPLGGLPDKRPEFCRIETKSGGCGCAFGQCKRGLIY